MSYKEFSEIDNFNLPKILHLNSANREVLYFGTYHSNSVNDSLFTLIEQRFTQFDPTFILHEGGSNWPIFKDRDSTVAQSGEPGFIIHLAKENNIPFESIEPEEELEYGYLLNKFELNWVVLMYMCRQIDNQQRLAKAYGTTDEQFVQNMNYFFRMLKDKGLPLNKYQLEFTHWKQVYQEQLEKKLEWRKFDPDIYYPNKYLTKLNEVNRASDEFRNLYMIDKIVSASETYNKVFVLVGGGHLVVQEELLKHKFSQ